MTNCCGNPECKRPFGLVRRSWYFQQFCSAKCREIFKRQQERNRTYWKWLYNCPSTVGRGKKLIQPQGEADTQGAIMTTVYAMLVGAILAWAPTVLVFIYIVRDMRNTRSLD